MGPQSDMDWNRFLQKPFNNIFFVNVVSCSKSWDVEEEKTFPDLCILQALQSLQQVWL